MYCINHRFRRALSSPVRNAIWRPGEIPLSGTDFADYR
jgi:hypothetical protein